MTTRPILAVLAAGLVARLLMLSASALWYDEATTGIMGLAVLRGELPIYFFGQPFMGALDAYLAAPVYVVLGISARTVELVGLLCAVAWMVLTVRLASDAYGPPAARWTALFLAIPPDYLLRWSHEARPHYPLAMALGTLALCLALRAPVAAPARAVLQFGLLGGVLGLAFWTNFLSLVFVPPVAVLVLWRLRARGLRPALAALPAFALGSLPHWLYGLQHGTALPSPGSHVSAAELWGHLELLGAVAWPILCGVPAAVAGTTGGALLAGGLAAVHGGAALAALRSIRLPASVARSTAVALLVLVATNLVLAAGTEYGRFLAEDARHLLPLYTALPVLLGRWLGRLGSRWAAGIAAPVLLVHLIGAAQGELRSLAPAAVDAARVRAEAERQTIATLEREGPRRLYAPDFTTRLLVFLSAERLVFSQHYEEIYPRYALLVDGAETAGWWFGGRNPEFEATVAALGARFAYRPAGPLGGAYVDFALRSGRLRELDPAGFTVTASEGERTAAWVVDRDARTLWRTIRPMRGGEWVQVDLGRAEPVALVRWLPGKHQEVPRGLVLEASLDGGAWQPLVVVPRYVGPLYWSAGRPMGRVRNGRIELRVPPTPARYLRITQTGDDASWSWSIRELFVYAGADGPAAVWPVADGATLATALRQAGVVDLYADHGWGSRAALADPGIRILPANFSVDPYGFVGPPAAFLPRFRWDRRAGVLLEPLDAEAFAETMRASGLGFTRRAVSGLVLFAHAPPPPVAPGTPLTAGTLRVSASRRSESAGLAVDGDPGTRWATALPQAPGDWFQVELDAPRLVRDVRLWTALPTDWPRGVRLEGSEDGQSWRPLPAEVRTEGRHIWGGIALLRDGVEAVRLDFGPVRLRALRLVLTRGDGVFDWSIHELAVFGE